MKGAESYTFVKTPLDTPITVPKDLNINEELNQFNLSSWVSNKHNIKSLLICHWTLLGNHKLTWVFKLPYDSIVSVLRGGFILIEVLEEVVLSLLESVLVHWYLTLSLVRNLVDRMHAWCLQRSVRDNKIGSSTMKCLLNLLWSSFWILETFIL